MLNARVVILSALLLAMMAALSRPPQAVPVRPALPAIDWRNAVPVLTCPSDLPPDCIILWGP
jgi:hypothetical protein